MSTTLRWLALALLAVQPLVAGAHARPGADTNVIVLAESPLTLRLIASKSYAPPHRSSAHIHFERVFRFVIPAEIPVIHGSAGDHLAYLSFAFQQRHYVCLYRGNAHPPNGPKTKRDRDTTKYSFKRCNHGVQAGDEVAAEVLRLAVLNGDRRAGTTTVELILLDLSAPAPPPASELAESGLNKARAGDHVGAIEDYNRAIQQNSSDAYAYAYRSQSLRALGDDAGAQADIRQVLLLRLEAWDRELAADPDDADAYAGRAATRLSLGDAAGARDDYSAALALRPAHARTLLGLGNARYRLGDPSGALAEYGAALAADPNLIEAYLARAVVRAEVGDSDGANADRLAARLATPTDQVSH
jgi:tetratricopeptide (TPR) repeat protein